MKELSVLIRSGILAGICVGFAGFGFLATGGITGAIIFAFGLLTVVNYKFKLYTGTAGFIAKGEFGSLCLILLANIIGCLLVALLARVSPLPIQDKALSVLEARLANGWWKCGLLSIGCGFIMTTAVKFAREGRFLPLLFGVPLFIFCGFPHCVADAFYYLAVPFDYLGSNIGPVLLLYLSIVAGNFIGCNLTRMILPEIESETSSHAKK